MQGAQAAVSDLIGKFLDYFLFVVQYLKDWATYRLTDLPYVGQMVPKIPPWVYAIIVVAVAVAVPVFTLLVLLKIKNKAKRAVLSSSLGTAIENRRTVKIAKGLLKEKEWVQAADLFVVAGDEMTAAKVLEQGEEWERAGKMFEKMGQLEKAVDLYKKSGDTARMTSVLSKLGQHEKAAEVLLRTGKKLMAADSYEKAGKHTRAAELYSEGGNTLSAAECYEKADDYRMAAEMYERAYVEGTSSQEIPSPELAAKLREMSLKAGRYFEKTGDFLRSAKAYSRCKEYIKAGETALKGGDRELAAEYFVAGKQLERAAQVFKDSGDNLKACEVLAEKFRQDGNDLEAGRLYLEGGFYLNAASLFEQCGEYIKAADAHMLATDYKSAAGMYLEGGDRAKAAEAYLKAGMPREAAEMYIAVGEHEKASKLVEQSGDFMLAAELHRKLGNADKELAALQKVDRDSPRYRDAALRLAEIFKEQGNLRFAADTLVNAVGDAPADSQNLDLYYALGTLYEADQRYGEATDVFQKVLLVDFRYKDAETRKVSCERLVTAAAQASPSAPSQAASRTAGYSDVDRPASGAAAQGASSGDATKRYAIMQEIGRGGMGVVYKAKDNHLNRVVALKLLPRSISENPAMLKRFAVEARSAAQLTHANIVTLYDFHQAGGRSFITMELVDGVTLKKLMTMVDKLHLTKALKIIYQCCQGLDYAHKKGIIHRDIKPSNIMINKENIVKIMDFGLAKMAGEETLTDAGSVSGTVMYMAPEQLLGKKVDRTTDIYALGLVLYELATGSHPFAAGDPAYNQVHTAPRPPRELRPEIPANLNAIIMKCLEKEQSKRFESVLQLALALREVPLKPS